MHGFVDVTKCDGFQAPRRRMTIEQKRQSKEWIYYIAAEEVVWDYAPTMNEHVDEWAAFTYMYYIRLIAFLRCACKLIRNNNIWPLCWCLIQGATVAFSFMIISMTWHIFLSLLWKEITILLLISVSLPNKPVYLFTFPSMKKLNIEVMLLLWLCCIH